MTLSLLDWITKVVYWRCSSELEFIYYFVDVTEYIVTRKRCNIWQNNIQQKQIVIIAAAHI
jgi:hypothetical protein